MLKHTGSTPWLCSHRRRCTSGWRLSPLKAGKHAINAVPAGMLIEQLEELIEAVKTHGVALPTDFPDGAFGQVQ